MFLRTWYGHLNKKQDINRFEDANTIQFCKFVRFPLGMTKPGDWVVPSTLIWSLFEAVTPRKDMVAIIVRHCKCQCGLNLILPHYVNTDVLYCAGSFVKFRFNN